VIKCKEEKVKEDMFILKRDEVPNLLCTSCFKGHLNEEVEIYQRVIIKEFSKGGSIRLEDYIIILNPKSVELPENYEPYKKQTLKEVTVHESVKALVVLNGWAKFPDDSPHYSTNNIVIPIFGI